MIPEGIIITMKAAFNGMNPRVRKVHRNIRIKTNNVEKEIGILIGPSLGIIVHKVIKEGKPIRTGFMKLTNKRIEVYGRIPNELINAAKKISSGEVKRYERYYGDIGRDIIAVYISARGSLISKSGKRELKIEKEEMDKLTKTFGLKEGKLRQLLERR